MAFAGAGLGFTGGAAVGGGGGLFAALPLILGAGNAIASYIGGQQSQDFSNQQAQNLEKAGQLNAAQVAVNRRKLAGEQRVAAAASGVVVSVGSPLDVMMDSFLLGLIEEVAVRFNFNSRAEAVRAQGRIAAEAGAFQAGQAVLGGILGAFDRGLFATAAPSTSPAPTIPASTTTRSGGFLVLGGEAGV